MTNTKDEVSIIGNSISKVLGDWRGVNSTTCSSDRKSSLGWHLWLGARLQLQRLQTFWVNLWVCESSQIDGKSSVEFVWPVLAHSWNSVWRQHSEHLHVQTLTMCHCFWYSFWALKNQKCVLWCQRKKNWQQWKPHSHTVLFFICSFAPKLSTTKL